MWNNILQQQRHRASVASTGSSDGSSVTSLFSSALVTTSSLTPLDYDVSRHYDLTKLQRVEFSNFLIEEGRKRLSVLIDDKRLEEELQPESHGGSPFTEEKEDSPLSDDQKVSPASLYVSSFSSHLPIRAALSSARKPLPGKGAVEVIDLVSRDEIKNRDHKTSIPVSKAIPIEEVRSRKRTRLMMTQNNNNVVVVEVLSVGEEVEYVEPHKVKGYDTAYIAVINKVHADDTYDVTLEENGKVHEYVKRKFLTRKSFVDLMSLSKMPKDNKGTLEYYANLYKSYGEETDGEKLQEEVQEEYEGLEGEALISRLKNVLRRTNQEKWELNQELKKVKREASRMKEDLEGSSKDIESYLSNDTKHKLEANKLFCAAIKNHNVASTGTNVGNNLAIAYLEAAAMNTTTILMSSGVVGDSVLSMINYDERKSELIARKAKQCGLSSYSVEKMDSSTYIDLRRVPHKALWLDYEGTYKTNELDVKNVFKNGLFSQGGVLGLTCCIRGDREVKHLEVSKDVRGIASENGYKVSLFAADGRFHDLTDAYMAKEEPVTKSYVLMKLFIYLVEKV